jgi:hypothetical protein
MAEGATNIACISIHVETDSTQHLYYPLPQRRRSAQDGKNYRTNSISYVLLATSCIFGQLMQDELYAPKQWYIQGTSRQKQTPGLLCTEQRKQLATHKA